MNKEVPQYLLETGESFEQKYNPVLHFEDWMIAMLRQIEKTKYENLKQAERHNLTNEVFILTEGEADLVVFENGNNPGKEFVIPMKKSVAYNIPAGVWHLVIMNPEAHIILFEKSDTTRDNSDYYQFDESKITFLKEKIRRL